MQEQGRWGRVSCKVAMLSVDIAHLGTENVDLMDHERVVGRHMWFVLGRHGVLTAVCYGRR